MAAYVSRFQLCAPCYAHSKFSPLLVRFYAFDTPVEFAVRDDVKYYLEPYTGIILCTRCRHILYYRIDKDTKEWIHDSSVKLTKVGT